MKFFLLLLTGVYLLQAADSLQVPLLGDQPDGNRATPIHHIKLLDQDSSVIYPDEHPLLPFSTQKTCGPCHNYAVISRGWHFNAADSAVDAGRQGPPFIWLNRRALIQIPLSHRSWPGLFNPKDLGITALQFVSRFGGYMPGGGVAADTSLQTLKNYWRWQVSGQAEVNCFACHDASPLYDAAEYVDQMKRQNFRWAATASTDLARVEGSARNMPDNFDLYWGVAPNEPRKQPPTVTYDARRFDKKGQVDLVLTRKIPDDRCYFCHSQKFENNQRQTEALYDDVHLKAGLHCVECHQNKLDHQIDRGLAENENSCENCHLNSGRFGAPKPQHKGLPPVHLEKVACTTCHSGPQPLNTSYLAHTSLAHELGTKYAHREATALPHIQAPVFARNAQGKIAPNYMAWPVFWAIVRNDSLSPIPLEQVDEVISPLIARGDSLPTEDWPLLNDSLLTTALDTLAQIFPQQQVVLVAGTNRFFLNSQKQLTVQQTDVPEPYLWPLAHDVRPAAQALGANGCTDCHSLSAPFFNSKIRNETILSDVQASLLPGNRFMKINQATANLFSSTFLFRPLLKIVVVLFYLLLLAVFVLYFFKGINYLINQLNQQQD
ncbi:MAG TPA: hypothetical protein ENL21_06515 [Caldithrix abyssi]|uniref:Tetrahaem cytochrome domain-containing protein n=1 Tax=Caldithrix abyssi TaxID=187145 RepID=A0A7V5LIT7_CALAY|nr:hypothetical protein [Caldithrix abyssi]